MAHTRSPRHGFTLLELIVVLLVLGVLATIVVVGFRTVTHKAAVAAATANLTQLDHTTLADQANSGAGSLSLTALTAALSDSSVTVQVGTSAQATWTLLGPTSTAANSTQFAVGFDTGPNTPVVADTGTRMAVVTVADGQGLAIVVTTSGATTKNVGVVAVAASTTPAQMLHADAPPPPAPTGLAVSNLTPTGGHITWTAVPSADSYDVAVNGTTVATAVTGTAADIAGTGGATVNITVRATSAAGSSAWSAPVAATFPLPGLMQLTYNLAASGCTSTTITLDTGTPTKSGGTVDWGDGTVVAFGSTPTHTYATPGTYQVSVHGQFSAYGYPNQRSQACLTAVSTWQSTGTTDASNAFSRAKNLTTVAQFPVGLTKTAGMFAYASAFNGPVSTLDMSHVTDASSMFLNASSFNQPVDTWDTSNLTTIQNIFSGANAFNQPLDSWNTSHVTNMAGALAAHTFNQPLDKWDTSHVVNMSYMFCAASNFNADISTWNTSQVTSMYAMFQYAYAFNQPIGSWNTGNVTDGRYMFGNATAFNQPLNNWDVSHLWAADGMFEYTNNFNQPLNSWNTASLTSTNGMFASAVAFNGAIGNWNMSNVTDLGNMFSGATAFNQPIGTWDTSANKSLYYTFAQASAFNQPIGAWNTAKVTNMNGTFDDAIKFNQDLSTWSVASSPVHGAFDSYDAATWTLPRPPFTS